jgi:hypothetical protein
MSVGAVESVALTLAARPDLAGPAGATVSKMASQVQESQATPRVPESSKAAVVTEHHVDVYA